MASIGTTSRKPSASSTHSPGQSRSQSPLSIGHVPRSFSSAGISGDTEGLKGSTWQDTSLGTSKAQVAAARLAPLALSRNDAPAPPSISPNPRTRYASSASPYSTQFASLLPVVPGTFDARRPSVDSDLAGGIRPLNVQTSPLASAHSSPTPTNFGSQAYSGAPHYTTYSQTDMASYYVPPMSPQTFSSFPNYQYRQPMTPSMYSTPGTPGARAGYFSGMPTPQISSTSLDPIHSPTFGYYPDYPSLSQQSPYFYPSTPTHVFQSQTQSSRNHQVPQSPHIPRHVPFNPLFTGDRRPSLQTNSLGIHSQQSTNSRQSNLQRHSSMNVQHSSRYGNQSNLPPLRFGAPARAVSSSASMSTTRGSRNMFRENGTPRGRRQALDTSSSGTDSGIVLRSPLLDEFRNGKARKWDLEEIIGHVVEFSSDQHGSRFIQTKIETAPNEEKQLVFNEILPDHALSLMSDVFGNYVVQRMFEHGSPAQREVLISQMSGHILELSLQMYGCRVVQKAIDYISPEQQTAFINEIYPDALKCVEDSNGNHVIQKLIQRIAPERLTLTRTFLGHIPELATHPYGCRVLQRCFEHLSPGHTRALVAELTVHALSLMQDQFGNYVVQYVLEHGDADDRAGVVRALQSHLLLMSRHKFASNVCEKALVRADSIGRRQLVAEILGGKSENAVIQAMMKDQYANYVLQRALTVADPDQVVELINKIRPLIIMLRRFSNIYQKHLSSIEKLIVEKTASMAPNAPRAPRAQQVPQSAYTEYRITPVVEVDDDDDD